VPECAEQDGGAAHCGSRKIQLIDPLPEHRERLVTLQRLAPFTRRNLVLQGDRATCGFGNEPAAQIRQWQDDDCSFRMPSVLATSANHVAG
jgi:hypothetical protein